MWREIYMLVGLWPMRQIATLDIYTITEPRPVCAEKCRDALYGSVTHRVAGEDSCHLLALSSSFKIVWGIGQDVRLRLCGH